MRRHSNSQEPLSSEDLKYDARALAIFISAVFGVDVPHELNVLIPHTNRPYQKGTGNQQPPHPLHREELGQRFHPRGY